VAVGIFEIDAAAAVAGVDLAVLALRGIGPVGKLALADPREDLVEFGLVDEERIVLGGDLAVGVDEVERHFVARLHAHERPKRHRGREAENFGQERRGSALVACVNDSVIQLGGHG